ncbi:MAG: hypothetical protein QOD71_3344 [Thermoleophilaceae bacterium]|jgi:hypothetical protein|nr:hypothetical protein [Thermoleophilaceae bacterium]
MVAVAVLVGAWLLVSYRGVTLEAQGQALLDRAHNQGITAAELSRGRQELDRARRFSADTSPLLTEGQLLDATRDRVGAARIATRLTKEEPENVGAWFLAYFTAGPDKARAKHALRELRRLNPWAADGLR